MEQNLIITALTHHIVNGYHWRLGDKFRPTIHTDKLVIWDRGHIVAMNNIQNVETGEEMVVFTVKLHNMQSGEIDHYTISKIDTILAY